jgi:hypothetical protein
MQRPVPHLFAELLHRSRAPFGVDSAGTVDSRWAKDAPLAPRRPRQPAAVA